MSDRLQKAVMHMLGPLVRLLLRHGVSHAAFADWARQVYVREAFEHFGIDGKPPTVSRIAIVTGINRKEVKRLRELPDDVDTGVAKHNRAVRVVSGWLRDTDFTAPDGRPRVLVYGDGDDSFNQLVRRHGGDVPARALLAELERVGTVEVDGSHVTLVRQGYEPHRSEAAMLDLFATSARDLLTTLEHNLASEGERRLQVSVAYDHVDAAAVARFRHLSAERVMTMLRQLDAELAPHDRDVEPRDTHEDETDRHRTGIGVYFIEERS